MTSNVAYCFEDQDIDEAGRIMQENKIRRVPVMNPRRRLVGIVSIGDIALGTGDSNLVYAAPKKFRRPTRVTVARSKTGITRDGSSLEGWCVDLYPRTKRHQPKQRD
jgi:CBS-domain-containing membrane protein